MGFSVFLTVFLSLYTGLHFYAYLKIRHALTFPFAASIAVAVFMGIMIVSPILVRLLERAGWESISRFLAYIGFTWMGLLFVFVSLSFAFDLLRLLLFVGRWVLPSDLSVTPRQTFLFSVLLTGCIGIYGAFEALGIRTEHIRVRSPKIPESAGRIRIVQISDVHIGLIVGEKRLKRILTKVKAAKPDIFISTGDLVDGQMDDVSTLTYMLRDIPAAYGKYAVTGNHEFYAGLDRSLGFTRDAGFTLLRGEAVDIGGVLNIAGVDDEAGRPNGLFAEISERELLSKLPRDRFTLFLKHRPLLDESALGLFDLQVSGHTHKGQIFPFSLVTMLSYPEDAGMLKLKNNTLLYVSRGSGTWGPPIRFLSPPEVTVIDLVHGVPGG